MVAVSRYDIELAFSFVNSAAPMEHRAYISLDTGQIYWVSELNPIEEEVPEDLEDSGQYIAVPHKNELGLGRNLALEFARDEIPARYREVEGIFHRRGAYRQFKDLLASAGLLEKWYKFEEATLDNALREWCADNEIEIIESPTDPSA